MRTRTTPTRKQLVIENIYLGSKAHPILMKNKTLSFLFFAFVALISTNALEVIALESFNANYKIYKGPLKVGSIKRSLEIDNSGHYVFKSRMESSGFVKFMSGSLLSETSQGKISSDKVLPESYIRETDKKNKNYTLFFDRKNNSVQRTDVDSGYQQDMESDTYDKLSYQAQMMIDLGAISPGGLTYDIGSQKKIVKYKITLVGKKEISSPAGTFQTVIVNRKDPNSSKETTVYCASELNWLPVRIEHTDKKGRSMAAKLYSWSKENIGNSN